MAEGPREDALMESSLLGTTGGCWVLVCLLIFMPVSAAADTHSLEFQYLVYGDPRGLQHFHQTTLLNGVVVFHCESPALRDHPRQEWITHTFSAQDLLEREEYCKDQYYVHNKMLGEIDNMITESADLLQRRRGCMINSSGVIAFDEWAVNGRDFLTFEPQTLEWTALSDLAGPVAVKWSGQSVGNHVYGAFGQSDCTRTHRMFQQRRAAWLQQAAKQDIEVRLNAKFITGSAGISLSCHVTHSDLSGLRIRLTEDGVPIEHGLQRTGPLPNGDETVQTRLQVQISTNRAKTYRCEIESDAVNFSVLWDERLLEEPDLILPVVGVLVGSALLILISLHYIHRFWKGSAGYKKVVTDDIP